MSPPVADTRAGFAAILGWTNVGKSSLLNRLVGSKLAAVADVAQTTRHRITGVCSVPGSGQIVFVDTPGLHRPRHRMNRVMLEAALGAITSVDLVLLVIDAARGFGDGDREAAERLARANVRRLLVLNKIDLLREKSVLLPLMAQGVERLGFEEAVPVSALTGEGCDLLRDRVLAWLPAGPPLFPDDYLTDQPQRALAAEWIREKLLAETRQELPHATAVLVERWIERDDLVEIHANVLVERDSQKRIVVGSEGSLLKRVGTRVRPELEQLLGRRVYLRLWVKVRGDWRENERILRDLGVS
jgi:GTP-binding protein Era